MAFVTGTANSAADLLAAVTAACTANGWMLSGSVLSRGGCFAELTIASGIVRVQCGRGIDGGNALTGRADKAPGRIGGTVTDRATSVSVPFAWPVTYFIHVLSAPDEVYVVVRYNNTYYQTLAFGRSVMQGLANSGNWHSGMSALSNSTAVRSDGEYTGFANGGGFSLFCQAAGTDNATAVDHGLDAVASWAIYGAHVDWASLHWRQPNVWNSESILIPIRVYASRPSGFISPVLECAHARFARFGPIDVEQVITIGPDRWKVYPWWYRGAAYTTGGGNGRGTGIAANAIRYDGP